MADRIEISPFSLGHTLECGQFFRYTKCADTYLVQSCDRIFSLYQKGHFLYYDGVEASFLTRFFRLGDDIDAIMKEIDRDPVIHQAIEEYPGLRLLRQDPWECMISFLCSSAKAIPHIRTMIEFLCRVSGRKILRGNYLGYGFPEPGCIETPLQLETVRAGFRTGYLLDAMKCMDRAQLLALRTLPYREARKSLMKLAGIGEKVADCTLLYSLDFLEAFPMDTWIKRGLQKAYFGGRKVGEKELERFVSCHFGPFAGYAQLYLFHFWRHHPL